MPVRPYPEPLRRTSVQIPESQVAALHRLAATRGPRVSVSDLMRDAIRLYLAVNEGAFRSEAAATEPVEVAS